MARSARVLIVEDDADVRNSMAEYLVSHGFEVDAAEGGDAMRAALARNVPQVVLLDLKLPGEDGLSLARSLRERNDLAIIMVTAADSLVDRVVGLEVGADDYIAKPFDLRELLARVKSVLRRTQSTSSSVAGATRTINVGDCSLDLGAHRLLDSTGAEVPLTSMEFDLLHAFIENPNQVLSRDKLLNLTRNRDWEPFDRSIDIRIARLRRKLGDNPDKPRLIKTVRGAGYCYVPAR